MEELAKVAARGGGRILEVGFGMGISASFLSEHGALQHIVAEPNRQVFNTSMQHARSAVRTLSLVHRRTRRL